MAVVKPFLGWHYNQNKTENLNDVVAPPYDVISPDGLARMRAKSPYHYSRIILPEGENGHRQAAQLFKEWQKEEILVQDKKPCLYFYRQSFELTPSELFCQNVSGVLTRTSVFCRIGLEDYSSRMILPHEKTFSGPKADRYKLMEEAQGNLEPVFLGYDSPRFSGNEFEKVTLGKAPNFTYTDDAQVHHELWSVDDENVIGDAERILKAKKFFILDGHHRYETALKFYHDHQKSDAKLDHRYVLAAICSFRQPGTVILPTHRALKEGDAEKAREVLKGRGWIWSPVTSLQELEVQLREKKTTCFGVKIKGQNSFILLEAKEKYKKLDLEVLHEEVLPHFSASPSLDYIKDIEELTDKVDQGLYQMGFLVRPSTIEEVMAVVEKGAVMPHKSTFFYPKIPSGLVINMFS